MPTWMDFGLKNPPKSALGRLLGRLVAVLGRLGVVLGRLGSVLRRLEGSWGLLGSSRAGINELSMVLRGFGGRG